MKAAFYTLGCKVNQYDTQLMEQRMASAGFDIVRHDEPADVYIVNSCTVTSESDRKTRQVLRRLKKQNPSAKVALTGCFPQSFPHKAGAFTEADLVIGIREREEIDKLVLQVLETGSRLVRISGFERGAQIERAKAEGFIGHTRAFVKIEDGCRRFCSYCIVPYSRGPVRSKPLDALREELEGLARSGYKEAVLVGINLSAYGNDLNLTLADAVQTAQKIPGLERIRLGSLEPNIVTEGFVEALKACDKLCPHFHLSLQSGCEKTLRAMNRHYTPGDYAQAVEKLRRAFPGCGIATDIIVGFPGETACDFEESLRFVQTIGFSHAHVFPYSRRTGTLAADMPGQIDRAEKEARAARMAAACAQSKLCFHRGLVGRTVPVLFEENREPGIYEGFSPNYVNVCVPSPRDLHGRILDVIITDCDLKGCRGVIANPADIKAR